uniref:Uncharacterized protein n=1 Tax=Rhizophora mucronata TaxID=61149 RepID=A0A2P2IPZ4_RHIMU
MSPESSYRLVDLSSLLLFFFLDILFYFIFADWLRSFSLFNCSILKPGLG